MGKFLTAAGQRLHIHNKAVCTPPCPFHVPSNHKMRSWPMLWRDDRRLLERICKHGVGHPDPDQLTYTRQTAVAKHADMMSIHGCDGCCEEEPNNAGQT